MPAIAALVLKDGQATPVNHTFNPVTTDGANAQYAERSAGVPAGYFSLSIKMKNPTTPTGAYQAILGFNIPITAVVNGVTTVVRNSSAQVTLNMSSQSTDQERKDLLAYVTNALADTTVKAAIVATEPFY